MTNDLGLDRAPFEFLNLVFFHLYVRPPNLLSRHPATFSGRSNSYMLLLSVKNFTWKRSEDMELFTTPGGKDGNAEPRF